MGDGSIGGPALGGFSLWLPGNNRFLSNGCAADGRRPDSYCWRFEKPLPQTTDEQGIVEKIRSGLRFVFRNPIILSAISLDLFAVLFGGAVALLRIFADEILMVGKEGLGILRSAPSVGALLMAVYITHHPIMKNTGKILLYCVAGFGVSMIFFALSTNFWLSLFLLMLSGMFDCISVIIRGTLLQTLTPKI